MFKTSELTGAALDWLVAKCLFGNRLVHYRTWLETVNEYWKGKDCSFAELSEFRILSEDFDGVATAHVQPYSTDWALAGPIIERELLEVSPHFWTDVGWHWVACVLGTNNLDDSFEQRGPTPLIAAMRCYVSSRLGDTVEIPKELLNV